MKISLYIHIIHISTYTCQKSYFLKHDVVEWNTKAIAQKCFVKTIILKNVRKVHW